MREAVQLGAAEVVVLEAADVTVDWAKAAGISDRAAEAQKE